jgi:hypothetical protein
VSVLEPANLRMVKMKMHRKGVMKAVLTVVYLV